MVPKNTLRIAPKPNMLVPNNKIVDGSGTGAGSTVIMLNELLNVDPKLSSYT